MKYAVVYSSKTGNTQMLAQTIKDALPAQNCVYFGTPDAKALEAQRIYVGFWTDKGTCDAETAEFVKTLDGLDGKEIFLFGTAGFGGDAEYFEKILNTVKEQISDTNTVTGTYMCQGKMPQSVRDRYEKMPIPNKAQLIANFDKALTHPDEADLQRLANAVQK